MRYNDPELRPVRERCHWLDPPSQATGGDAGGPAGDAAAALEQPLFDKGAYFIGKAVWGKGYSELLERLAEQKAVLDGKAMPIDVFGTGEDLDEACLISIEAFVLSCQTV